jgi:ribosome-binding protein aMBF1 (putative translation factor)
MSTRIRVIRPNSTVIIIATRKWVKITGGIHMDYSEIYVKRIRKLCKDRGIAINKLAVMSDVKQSTLDNIVRGLTKNPRIKTLHKIALAFNMTLAEFLDFDELNEYCFDDDSDDE